MPPNGVTTSYVFPAYRHLQKCLKKGSKSIKSRKTAINIIFSSKYSRWKFKNIAVGVQNSHFYTTNAPKQRDNQLGTSSPHIDTYKCVSERAQNRENREKPPSTSFSRQNIAVGNSKI